ncbi:hypothetical protein BJ878DRAFT_280781 [Calycina marina]|uniref:Uncharacterized protein n=1 Tax=Calycina marina TaxID=1763456 RepID=A0A9P7YV63_9HELO|nr:hypothetical protein BJ878DRAFT_280781 [Calycina marina]
MAIYKLAPHTFSTKADTSTTASMLLNLFAYNLNTSLPSIRTHLPLRPIITIAYTPSITHILLPTLFATLFIIHKLHTLRTHYYHRQIPLVWKLTILLCMCTTLAFYILFLEPDISNVRIWRLGSWLGFWRFGELAKGFWDGKGARGELGVGREDLGRWGVEWVDLDGGEIRVVVVV